MKDIDWGKAPEGATHFHPGNAKYSPHWLKKGYFCVTDFEHKGWVREVAGTPLDECVVRPTTPQWNGTGLPPVGVVCEYRSFADGFKWNRVEILLHVNAGMAMAAVFFEPGTRQVTQAIAECFRPIRTPEQIAAEERDAGIQQIMEAANHVGHITGYTFELVSRLYDHGCRMTAEDER